MKKYLLGIITAVTMTFFAGCGNDKPLTVQEIPASGAESFVTSMNSLAEIITNAEKDLEDDYWIEKYASQEFQDMIRNLIIQTNNPEQTMKMRKDIINFANDVSTKGKGKIVLGGQKIKPEILKPLKEYGLSIAGTQKPVVCTVKKSNDGINYDVKIVFARNYTNISFDGTTPPEMHSILKGAALKGTFNGTITAKINIIALNSIALGSYTSGFLNSLSDISIKYNFNMGFGGSFCNSNKEGGKFFVRVDSSADKTVQPEYFKSFDSIGEEISNLLDEEPYNADMINSIPAQIDINVGFYNDNNELTYSIINAQTFEGMFLDILKIAKQIPD